MFSPRRPVANCSVCGSAAPGRSGVPRRYAHRGLLGRTRDVRASVARREASGDSKRVVPPNAPTNGNRFAQRHEGYNRAE